MVKCDGCGKSREEGHNTPAGYVEIQTRNPPREGGQCCHSKEFCGWECVIKWARDHWDAETVAEGQFQEGQRVRSSSAGRQLEVIAPVGTVVGFYAGQVRVSWDPDGELEWRRPATLRNWDEPRADIGARFEVGERVRRIGGGPSEGAVRSQLGTWVAVEWDGPSPRGTSRLSASELVAVARGLREGDRVQRADVSPIRGSEMGTVARFPADGVVVLDGTVRVKWDSRGGGVNLERASDLVVAK